MELSDQERLVILAIAFELQRVCGTQVIYRDIQEISGIPSEGFDAVVQHLESRNLIEIEGPDDMSCKFLSLSGDAVNSALFSMEKLREYRSRYPAARSF